MTSVRRSSDPIFVVRFLTRLLVVLLALATVSANLAACGGWQATAAARMTCCAEGDGCPMHRRGHETSPATSALSQAAADACCASSEQTDATITLQVYALPALASAVVTLPEPDVAHPSRYRSSNVESPPPDRSVPRHLFLSVFLV